MPCHDSICLYFVELFSLCLILVIFRFFCLLFVYVFGFLLLFTFRLLLVFLLFVYFSFLSFPLLVFTFSTSRFLFTFRFCSFFFTFKFTFLFTFCSPFIAGTNTERQIVTTDLNHQCTTKHTGKQKRKIRITSVCRLYGQDQTFTSIFSNIRIGILRIICC